MATDSEPIPRWVAAVAVAILFGLAALLRYRFLASSPYAFGIDGYFYPVQLRSLLETGALRFPSAPLTLWLMAPLAAIWGPIAGVKIGAAIGTAALCIPVYALGGRVSGSRAGGLLASVLVATSPGSFYLATEFIKNGIALTLAAAAVWAVMAALDRSTRRRIALAIAAYAAVWLAHKLAFAIAVGLALPALWLSIDGKRRWLVAAAVGGGLAVVLGLGALFPERLISPVDVARVGDLFRSEARWTIPVLAAPELGFRGEVAIAGLLGLAIVGIAIYRRATGRPRASISARDRALAIAAGAICLLIALPWLNVSDGLTLGFRLRLVAFFPMAIAAAGLAGEVTSRARPAIAGALIAGFAFGLAVYRPVVYTEPVIRVNPTLVAAVRRVEGNVPAGDTVVIADRQVMYMTAWYTTARVALRPESIPSERRWRLFTFRWMDEEFLRALDRARHDAPPSIPAPISLHENHPDYVVLMPEVTWEWILAQLPPGPAAHHRRWPTT